MLETVWTQNQALLGLAYSVVKTWNVLQALNGETINQCVKSETGRDVSKHAMSLLSDEVEIQECDNTYSNNLQKLFFVKSKASDCKKIQ